MQKKIITIRTHVRMSIFVVFACIYDLLKHNTIHLLVFLAVYGPCSPFLSHSHSHTLLDNNTYTHNCNLNYMFLHTQVIYVYIHMYVCSFMNFCVTLLAYAYAIIATTTRTITMTTNEINIKTICKYHHIVYIA